MNEDAGTPQRPPTVRTIIIVAAAVIVLAIVIKVVGFSAAHHNRTTTVVSIEELMGRSQWLGHTLDKWRESAVATVKAPNEADTGAYPIGSGRAFGIVGLLWPLGSVTNLIGPGYQKKTGFFGNLVPWVSVGGKGVDFTDQNVTWEADAPIVVAEHQSQQGLLFRIYHCAMPDMPGLQFALAVANTGKHSLPNVSLRLTSTLPGWTLKDDRLVLDREGGTIVSLGVLDGRARGMSDDLPPMPKNLPKRMQPSGGNAVATIEYPLGRLAPGQSVVKLGYMNFAGSAQEEQRELAMVKGAGFEVFERVRSAWQKWTEPLVRVQTDDNKLDQFMLTAPYILLSQRDACGAFSPMHGYTYAWVRDSNGPLRYLAAAGMAETAGQHLDYHFRACAKMGKIYNNVALDMDVSGGVPVADWEKMPVERAEVPSFVILQHYWYWRATGDATLVKFHWPMLRRCLLGQEVGADGTLPFHGDETYRFPGYELFNAGEKIEDWVCLDARSADSAFEYVAAAQALAEMAKACGHGDEAGDYLARASRVRGATESLYWREDAGFYAPARSNFSGEKHRYPFANIDLRPMWIGYADATDGKQAGNVLRALGYLVKPSGTVRMTPGCGYYVGMTPGYVVWNLAEMRHPAVLKAMQGMFAAAEASGGYSEMVTPDDRPSDKVWGWHRCRPWETGINAEAALHALTGYKGDVASHSAYLRPLMVGGPSMWVRGLPLGSQQIDVQVKDTGGSRKYILALKGLGQNPVNATLAVVVWGSGLQVSVTHGGSSENPRVAAGPSWPWAQEAVVSGLLLTTAKTIEITATYRPSDTSKAWIDAQPFQYGAANPPGGKALVITPAAEQVAAAAQSLGGAVASLDTKIPWPGDYLRSALLNGAVARYPVVVLDVDGWPGAFKTKEFWTTGPGGEALAAYGKAGGKIERVAKPSGPPAAPAGLTGLK
jgi:hypothetical protein